MLLFIELGIPIHHMLALLPAWDSGLYTWRKAAEFQDAFISLGPYPEIQWKQLFQAQAVLLVPPG